MNYEPLSRPWTPEEVAEETRGIDERLPEARTVNRGSEPSARTAGSLNLPGHEAAGAVDQRDEIPRRHAEPQPSPSESPEGA